ncbi:MAG TPA: family 10 glycosylhydrolase, partial [Thermoanaerobaculia bacterium]
MAVVLDVVRRYDVDGVHFDDYFYPYPERTTDGAPIAF